MLVYIREPINRTILLGEDRVGFGWILKKDRRKMKDEFDNDIKPLEYYETLNKEVKPLEDIMVGFSTSLPGIKCVDDKIAVLKSLIYSYYDLRSKCVSLGKDYEEYFSRMWEHCHNSKNPDFCFIERYESELKELEKTRDILFAEEELHAKESVQLKARVMSLIKEHDEILQIDIYKEFDPVVQKDIQSILYFFAQDGIIERKKIKNTYLIKLVVK